eukprot:544635-Karenia_brevis.AAC.1
MDMKFVDEPTQLNETKKDSSIKKNVSKMRPEFWWLARCLWLVPKPHAGSDRTLPQCPNT